MNPAFKRFRLVEDDEFLQREKGKLIRDYDPELMHDVQKKEQMVSTLESSNLPAELKLLMLRVLNHSLRPVEQSVRPHLVPKDVHVSFDQPGFRTEIPIANLPIQDRPVAVQVQPVPGQPQPVAGQLLPVQPAIATGATEEEDPVNFDRLAKIVETLPKANRPRATQLAQIIAKDPNRIRVSENNELIIDGLKIANSNARQMFGYMYNPRKGIDAPLGYAKFIKAIVQLKVPTTLISNRNVQNFLRDSYQSGQGKRVAKPIGYAKRIPPPPTKRPHAYTNSLNSLKLYKI